MITLENTNTSNIIHTEPVVFMYSETHTHTDNDKRGHEFEKEQGVCMWKDFE